MKGTAMLGRLIQATGLVFGVVAIWISYAPHSKYSDDGTVLTWLLILAGLTVLSWVGSWMTNERKFDTATGVFGGMMFGFYLLIPALTAFGNWGVLETGAWLGLCSGLTVIGTWIAAPPDTGERRAVSPATVRFTLLGLLFVLIGIGPSAQKTAGSYWGAGSHGAGIVLIVLVAFGVLAVIALVRGMPAADDALTLATLTFGFVVALPVGNAFNNFGNVGAGGWLAFAGGLVALLGVLAMRGLAIAWAPRRVPMTNPAATPPPA